MFWGIFFFAQQVPLGSLLSKIFLKTLILVIEFIRQSLKCNFLNDESKFSKKYISYGIASKDKNKRFSKLFKTEWLRRDMWSEEKFQKTLILAF